MIKKQTKINKKEKKTIIIEDVTASLFAPTYRETIHLLTTVIRELRDATYPTTTTTTPPSSTTSNRPLLMDTFLYNINTYINIYIHTYV